MLEVRQVPVPIPLGRFVWAGTPPTVAVWLTEYLDTVAARRVRPVKTATGRWPGCTSSHVGHHRLDRLQPEHVERMYTAMADTGLSSATVRQAHRLLSRALKIAMQREPVGRNVCSLVNAPSPPTPTRQGPRPRRAEVAGGATDHRAARTGR